jgi:hypothetical protein
MKVIPGISPRYPDLSAWSELEDSSRLAAVLSQSWLELKVA